MHYIKQKDVIHWCKVEYSLNLIDVHEFGEFVTKYTMWILKTGELVGPLRNNRIYNAHFNKVIY